MHTKLRIRVGVDVGVGNRVLDRGVVGLDGDAGLLLARARGVAVVHGGFVDGSVGHFEGLV